MTEWTYEDFARAEYNSLLESKCVKWVKCSERLPKENSKVLLTDGKTITMGYVVFPEERSFIYFYEETNCFSDKIGSDMTHWAELPEAPTS